MQTITADANISRQKAMYEAKSEAEKGAFESKLLEPNNKHHEEVDRLKVDHKSNLRDLIRRHAEDALSRKQQVKEFEDALSNVLVSSLLTLRLPTVSRVE